MKRLFCFVLILTVLSINAFSAGMAVPPNKNFNAIIDMPFSVTISLINQEGQPDEFKIYFEGSLADRAKAYPPVITVDPVSSFSDAIENVRIDVNSTGLLPGSYDLTIIAETYLKGSGALSIIQKLTRTISIKYEYPPSFLSRILNFIITTIRNIFDYIIGSIKQFYYGNPWLNYLFVTLLLGLFFYAGIKAKQIMKAARSFMRRIEKIRNHIKNKGFLSWIVFEIRNIFKKAKGQNKPKENAENKEERQD